jgi:hypothetical protein
MRAIGYRRSSLQDCEPDCAPVRVQLLGQELVAFRDTEAHRAAG